MLASTESGSYQLHAWDRVTGRRRQVTRDPVGVTEGRPTRDGTGVVWFRDETGAETGSYVIAPFDEDVAAEPLIEGLPKGWSEGLAIGRARSVAAVSTDEGFSVWAADNGDVARRLYAHENPVRLAGGWGLMGSVDRGALSADDRVAVLEVMEDGDVLHPSLRAIDARTGETLAELRDPGLEVAGFGFSPLPVTRGWRSRASTPASAGPRCGTRRRARSSGWRSISSGRWSPWTGGRTGPRCSCSISSRAGTTCTATTSPRARSWRSTRSRARSRPPPSGRTGRSGTGSMPASIPLGCSPSGSPPRCSSPTVLRPPRVVRSSRGGSAIRRASGCTASWCARRARAPGRS